MYVVNENAACVLVALIAATALCGVYGMFLLLSKGVRILGRIRRKGLRMRGPSSKRKMEVSRASVAPVTPVSVLLLTTAWDNPSDQP